MVTLTEVSITRAEVKSRDSDDDCRSVNNVTMDCTSPEKTPTDNHASLSPENCKYEATNKNQRRDFSYHG